MNSRDIDRILECFYGTLDDDRRDARFFAAIHSAQVLEPALDPEGYADRPSAGAGS